MITTQLTPYLPDNGVKHAHLQEQTARVFLVLEQIRGNLSSDINAAELLSGMEKNMKIAVRTKDTGMEKNITGGTS